ncbi:TPA: hypothetical protein PDO63_002589 [Staphylococcus aureus]|nr:hypothetical protein [Staphylococcus aureus]
MASLTTVEIIPASPLLRPAFIAPRLTASSTELAGTSDHFSNGFNSFTIPEYPLSKIVAAVGGGLTGGVTFC